MGVLGDSSKRRQVIFVVDASTALSGIFTHLLTEYIVPCIEHFNGGPFAEKTVPMQASLTSLNYYGLITIKPLALFSVPSCNYFPITSSPEVLLENMRNICFEGNIIEHCCRVSEGLAAAMEFLEITKAVVNGSYQLADTDIEKYCILITNLPPSSMPVMESIKYGNLTYMQLAEEMAKRNINLSVITPRWLKPYAELFVKGNLTPPYDSNILLQQADHALHPGCMVLLRGLEVPSLRARKVKPELGEGCSSLPSENLIDDIKGDISGPPSISQPPSIPSLPRSVPPDVIANPASVPMPISETPPPSLPSSIRKTSSVSSLADLQPSSSSSTFPGFRQLSPKGTSPGNPASVPTINISGSGVPPEIDTSRTSNPLSSSPQTNTLNSSPQRSAINPILLKPTFPTSSSTFLDMTAPVGSSTNPIQISSPGIENKPFAVTSVTTATAPPPAQSTAASTSSSLSTLLAMPNPPLPRAGGDLSLPSYLQPTCVSFSTDTTAATVSTAVTAPSAAELTAQQIVMEAARQAANKSLSVPQPAPNLQRQFVNIPPPSSAGVSGIVPPTSLNPSLSASFTGNVSNFTQGTAPGITMVTSQPSNYGSSTSSGQIPMPSGGQNPMPGVMAGQSSIPAGQIPMPGGGGQMPSMQGSGSILPAGQIPIPGNQAASMAGQQGSSMPPPPGAGQPFPQPVTKVWSGYLETIEMRQQRQQPRQIQCNMLLSKPEVTAEIKPELWPGKISMSVYPKSIFNEINMIIRINSTPLRTVQFQFMENIHGVMMLRALTNPDPQNKKVAIVRVGGMGPTNNQCPIKAFFMVWNDKSRQFTGLIPLEQENFISALKQVLSNPAKMQQLSGTSGLPMSGGSNQPYMPPTQGGIQSGLMTGNQTNLPAAAGGGAAGGQQQHQPPPFGQQPASQQGMFTGQQQQQQMHQQQQPQQSFTSSVQAPPIMPQLPMTTTPLTSVGFSSQQLPSQGLAGSSGGGHQSLVNPLQRTPMMPSTGGMGAAAGTTTTMAPTNSSQQQQMISYLQSDKLRQVFEKATPEQKQMILNKLEQQKQQQQYQQQMQQQYQQQQAAASFGGAGGGGGQQQQYSSSQNIYNMPPTQGGQMNQPMGVRPVQQQQMVRASMAPPTQQQFPPPPQNSGGGTMDLFQL